MTDAKRILVTGASGFIGSKLVSSLNENSAFEVYSGLRTLGSNNPVNEVYIELSDINSILSLSDNYNFHAIVHLAAKVGWGGLSYEEMYTENVLATGALGYVAQNMGAKLLFGSAALVHGTKANQISLETPLNLDSDYARTKYHAERLLESILPNSCIFRIGGVFGKNGPTHLGLNKAISEALKGIPPTFYGQGEGLRNYLFVDDLCIKIVEAINSGARGTYLISGEEVLSIKTMLDKVCSEFIGSALPINLPESKVSFDQVICGTDKFGGNRLFTEALKAIAQEKI